MTVLFFPDNTVLINFALINRMDLLERLVNGRGAWCGTVAKECSDSSEYPGLAALDQAGRIFGEPYYPTLAEHQDLLVVQVELAKPGDSKDAHLGEAETIAIIVSRDLPGFFVTDDRDARRVASSRNIGVTDTWALLKLAFKAKIVDPDTLWGYVQTLKTARRKSPPGVSDRASFDAWLQV